MKSQILNIGKSLSKMEQKTIAGGLSPQFGGHYPDCPNVWIPCDGGGADCRFPFHVNQFGRCTL